jgi:hypothetical protein
VAISQVELVAAPTAPPPVRVGWLRVLLFGATAFIGAALLFVVEPLIAKLLLPAYGGSATVWSTSTLFFQVLLLLAYAYAHLSTTRLGATWQPRAHLVVLLVPFLALPLVVPADAAPPVDASPVWWLLRTLMLVIGLPFAVVATTGPLLQRWFSWGDHRRSEDPYFLFAASNLGSFGGLLAYPLLIEPHLTLAAQRWWWSIGFAVFVVLTGACALSVRRREQPDASVVRPRPRGPGPDLSQVLRWTALAFLPSSLMLAVTAHISTDIAAIPLLWVVPLAIYLATFVVAFARTSRTPPLRLTRVAVGLSFGVAVASLVGGGPPAVAIGLNLMMLALVGYAAHARLASERPSPEHLTAFFLVVSLGGALGGVLNGLVAPLVFDRVLEYPLVLVAIPLLLTGAAGDSWLGRQVRANPVRAGAVGVFTLLAPILLRTGFLAWDGRGAWITVVIAGAALVGWFFSRLPKLLALALVLLFVGSTVGNMGGSLDRSRTFYGSYLVEQSDGAHQLVHGTTLHGTQLTAPADRRIPTTYYSRKGPLGDVFGMVDPQDVAVVGLGAGTVAAYGNPGQSFTFYEIDPEIVRIARDPKLFTYLDDSRASIRTVVGDGRLGLAEEPPHSFDLVVLDAFSSDAIPVHLLSEEAMRTYMERLRPNGLLVVHITSRLFDLEPVLAGAAARLGLTAAVGRGGGGSKEALPSVWVALGSSPSVDRLVAQRGWDHIGSRRVTWTDDYSSILQVLR